MECSTWRASKVVACAGGLALVAAMMLPVAAAQSAQPVATITSGAITWGIKSSFRSYVVGSIAHGSIATTSPATDNGAKTTFPEAVGTWRDTAAQVEAAGAVRFVGHSGELDVTISDPGIVISGSTAHLVVDAVDSDHNSHSRLAVAELDLSGAVTRTSTTLTIADAKAVMTSAGSAIFALGGSSFYPAGTVLDPVSAQFAIEESEDTESPTPTTSPASSSPTSSSATPTLATTTATSTPTTTATSSASSTSKAKAGSLTWGIKSSFRSYVVGPIAKGAITVSNGADAVSGGYRFGQSATSATVPAVTGTTTYAGAIRFTGHHRTLDLRFSSPQVRATSTSSAVLSMRVSGFGRVNLATLALARGSRSVASGSVSYADVPATLTAGGAKVFSYAGSNFYPAGTALDQVDFTVGNTADTDSSGSSTQTYATTTASATASATATATVSASAGLAAGSCAASDVELTWGFKESFRAYLTGSIANGDWSTKGKVNYRTPSFTWSGGSGTVSPQAASGELALTGAVAFTGHHGALQISIADPVVRFQDAKTAVLVLDYVGTNMDDALAGKAKPSKTPGVDFVQLDLSAGQTTRDGDRVQIAGVPATLTTDGSHVFTNYTAGTAFDLVTLSYTLGECGQSAGVAAASTTPPSGSAAAVPAWVGWAASGTLGGVLGSSLTLLVVRRWLVKP